MRVLFDISVLGRGYFKNAARTGVFRAVDNLEKVLVNSRECTIELYAFESLKAYLGSYKHLMKYNESDLKKYIIEINTGFFKLSNNLVNYYDRNPYLNVLVNLYMLLLNKYFMSKVPPDKFDIFHSTFFPIPNKDFTGRSKRFITVYDLIPLMYPQYFPLKSNHLIRLIKKVIESIDRKNDFVICISESTKNDLCDYTDINPSRVFVTYLAADRDIFYKSIDHGYLEKVKNLYNLPEEPYFLTLGTLEPRKNIGMVIKCFGRLVSEAKLKDLKLVIVGTRGWNYQKIFTEVEKNSQVKGRIIFTGYVPDEDLAGIYNRALVFIYPSLYEGFGLPPLEAMQCGVPVITSNRSSLPEVVGDAGVMVDPTCEEEICHYMLKIANQESFREDLSKKAIERARNFSWQKCAQDTISAYKTALN